MTLASATAIARLPVKLFTKVANAGDAFNIQLLSHSSGRPIQSCGPAPLTETNLVFLGSILEWADVHSYVCGAALMRGPLTAAALVQQAWADPGILALAVMADALTTSPMSEDLAFGVIPHYVDRDAPALQAVDRNGGVVIDPQLPHAPYF